MSRAQWLGAESWTETKRVTVHSGGSEGPDLIEVATVWNPLIEELALPTGR